MPVPVHSHTVILNGSTVELPEEMTIAGLLQQLELDSHLVAVEQNAAIVPKREFAQRKIAAGDVIEIVHFVGGG